MVQSACTEIPRRSARAAPRSASASSWRSCVWALLRLPDLTVHRHEVVAVDRGRPRRHGAGWSLRWVVRIAADAILWRDVGSDHLQHVELRGDLEQRAAVLGRAVQGTDITLNDQQPRPAGEGKAGRSGTQLGEGGQA